ncbi:MAG: ROK family protein [Bacteroidales bacterium]|nr:ROK family protein [Bacteroidales bacterium]
MENILKFENMFEIIDNLYGSMKHRVKDKEKASIYKQIWMDPGITRKGIVTELHKKRPTTVSYLVAELIEQNLIYEGAIISEKKKGRPEVPLFIKPDAFVCIAAYIVSQQIKAVLLRLDGTVICENSVQVPSDIENDQLFEYFTSLVTPLIEAKPLGSTFLGIGISMVGHFNMVTQELIFSIRWKKVKNFSFRKLSELLDCKVHIVNSFEVHLNYLLIHEKSYRVGGSLIYHWVYGIGASFSFNGLIFKTPSGYILESGHVPIDTNSKKPCLCGSFGCVETEAALWAIIPQLLHEFPDIPNNEYEFASYFTKNRLSQHPVIKKATKIIAYNLATLIHLFYPNRIIFRSPFLLDKDVYDDLKQTLFSMLPEFLMDDILLSVLKLEFKDEIFGSTSSLFRNRFKQELLVKH